jgi:predicted metalloprotease with PDZ domain
MKKFLILFLFIFNVSFAQVPQNMTYQYFVNLVNVNEPVLKIELVTPKIEEETIIFRLPEMIPGTYRILDFGRYVNEVMAYDAQGNVMNVIRLDTNSWQIDNATNLYKLAYNAYPSFNDTLTDNYVYPMGGTNIEPGKNYVLNNHGFFGYFDGYLSREYALNITKPSDFYGSTSLNKTISEPNLDVIIAPNYQFLVDNPIMYNKPDTASIYFPECRVLISAYSPGGGIKAADLKAELEELLNAHRKFYGGTLPTDRYSFIFYFAAKPNKFGIAGALEHNLSSFYYFPDAPASQKKMVLGYLGDMSSHEFYHIITPLNLHAEQIANFDFNNPQMSEHLWLYEGVTEYNSHYIQLYEDLIDLKDYVGDVEQKLEQSKQYNDTLAFTEMSKNVLTTYKKQYQNVYQKGALIGLCLDILIRSESNGEQGLQDVINSLMAKYGKDTPFKDEELFAEITQRTSPAVGEFLNTYVGGNNKLPYKDIFSKIGLEYTATPYEVVDAGGFGLGFNESTFRFIIIALDEENEFINNLGLKVGDELYSVNGEVVNFMNIREKLAPKGNKQKIGDKYEVEVYRKNNEGKFELIKSSTTISKLKTMYDEKVEIMDAISPEQEKIRNAWMGKN